MKYQVIVDGKVVFESINYLEAAARARVAKCEYSAFVKEVKMTAEDKAKWIDERLYELV